eukprot:jgi/Mesvir1/8995/Mv21288-RA.1
MYETSQDSPTRLLHYLPAALSGCDALFSLKYFKEDARAGTVAAGNTGGTDGRGARENRIEIAKTVNRESVAYSSSIDGVDHATKSISISTWTNELQQNSKSTAGRQAFSSPIYTRIASSAGEENAAAHGADMSLFSEGAYTVPATPTLPVKNDGGRLDVGRNIENSLIATPTNSKDHDLPASFTRGRRASNSRRPWTDKGNTDDNADGLAAATSSHATRNMDSKRPFPTGQLQGRKLLQTGPCTQSINADGTVGPFTDSYGLVPTNWQRTLAVSQFDRGCGTLNSVSISFVGGVSGTAKYESLEAHPFLITLNLGAVINVRRSTAAGGAVLFTVNPVRSQVSKAGAYDNALDFVGTSGATYHGLNATRSNSTTLTTNLGEFISATAGMVGQVYFPTTATAASTGTSGNAIQQFNTNASATITVRYFVTPPPPPPPPPSPPPPSPPLTLGNSQAEGYCFVEGCNFEQYSVKPVLGSTVLAMDKENITVSNKTYSRWYLAGAGQAWKKVSNVNGVWIPKTDSNFRIIFRNTGIGSRCPSDCGADPPVDYPGRANLLSAKQALFWFEELCPYHLFQMPELECSAAAIFAAGTPFSGPNSDLGLGGYRHYLVNHHTLDDPWVEHVEAGNKTLLRLISSSTHSNLKCSLGTLGIATIVAADGQWVQPVPVTEFWLGVAQRLDILISNPVEPGAYPLVCAETSLPWITDRKKAGIVFVVGGAAYVPAPRTYDVGHSNGCASGVPEGTDGCAGAYFEMTHDTEKLLHAYYPLEAGPADVELTLNLTTTIMCDFATNLTSCTPENPIFRFGFDDQPWFTTPLGNDKPFVPNPNPIKVQLNQKVCINMVNKAAGDHIIHMHGHHFQVVEVDGQPIPGGGAMRDTVLVGDSYLSPQFVGQQRNWTTHINSLQNYPFKNTKICFLADNPGIWALHCHYSMHLVSGMMTTVEYTSSDSDPKPVRGCTNTNDEAFTLEATVDDGSCAGSNICANFDDNLPFAGLRQRFLRPPPALGSDFTDMKDELVVGADVLTLTHENMTLPNGFSYSKHRVEGKGPHFKTISNVGTLIMSTTTAHFRVLYRNKLNEPAIMHAHGLTPVHNLDGVSYLTSMPIQADRENLYVYELHPQNAGTYILHAHYGWGHDEGLAIPLVVQRPPPTDYPLVNELNNAIESIMFFEELCPYHKDPSKQVAPWECNAGEILKEGVVPLGPWHDLGLGGFRYYLANKRVLDNPWVEHMPAGAKVRLRMVNAAVESLFRCHLGALAPAQAVAVDGQWVHPVNLTDARNSLWVGTGQRLDLLLTMPNASGAYPLICDETNLPWIRDRKHVGVVFVVGGDAYVPAPGTYDVGHTKGCPPVENQDEFTAADGCNATNVDFLVMPHDLERKLHAFFPLSFVKNPIPVKEVTLNLTSDITCDPFGAPENCTRETPFLQFSFNYHRMGLPPGPVVPNDKPFLPNPVPIEVELGETVCINIVNRAAGDHIIHMHGHHFQVVELDGVPIPGGGAMRDTVMVSDSELSEYFPLFTGFRSAVEQRSQASLKNTKICFLADNPGVWAIHCHFNMHATMGMMTTIEYNAGKNDPPARYGCDNPDAANFVPGATSKGVANAEDLCFFYECLDESGPTDGSLTFAFYLLGATYERYVFSGGPGTFSAWIQDDVASYFNVARNAVSVPRTFTANQTGAPADAIYSEVVVRLPGGASPDGVLAKVRQLDTAADATFAFPVVGGYSGGRLCWLLRSWLISQENCVFASSIWWREFTAKVEGYCFVEGCNFEQYSVKPVLGSTVLAMDKENITVSNKTYSRWYLAGAGQAWKKVSNVNGVWIPKTDSNFRIIFRNTGIGGPGMMHAHGQTPVVSVDGVPYISGMPIYHNRESLYVYELHPQNGGSYLIHSHYGWGHDQGLGVPLIVERDPPVDYPGRADLLSAKQALFWFEELCPYHLFQTPELECSAAAIFAAGTPFSGPNNDLGLGGYRHYLVNHHTLDDPWVEHVEAGNKTLLRLISSSTHSNLKCSLGTLGIATIVAADGQWVQPVPVTEFWLGVAQRLDILISNPVEPGAYPLVCAETSLPWITDRKKAGIVFVVGGAAYVPAPRTYDVGHSNGCASGVPEGTDGCAGAYFEMTHDTEKLLHAYYPLEAGPADVELTLNLTTTIMCDFATNLTSCTPENPIFRFGFDDQPWFTTPLGNDKPFVPNPNPIKVQLNQKVCINMVNKAAGDHIIHMHGHHFQVVEVDGQPIPGGGAMRDTVLVGDSYLSPQFVGQQRNWTTHINSLQNYPFKNTKICFLADNPGIWALHCHYSMHLVSGMMTTVEYTSSDSDPKPVRGCTNTNDEAFTLEATVDDGSCAGSNICANFDDNLPFAGLRQRFLRPPPALGSDFTDMKDELVVGADVLTLTHENMTLPNGFSYSKHRVEGKGPHFKTISNVGTLIMSTTTAHFRVLYRNKLNEPAIMHAHGLTPVHNLDGVSYLTSMPIQADRENLYVYELHPQNAGTYILHAHYGWGHDEGLAIPLVVQRPPPTDYPLVNELNNAIESIMFFEELCPYHKDPSKQVAPWECNAGEILKEGVVPLGPWHDLGLGGFRYYLANKRVLDNPWVEHMPAGAKVRLRMVNAAVESLFRCHLGALAPAQAVAVDGQWVHPVNLTDARNSLWVGTGQRLDLLLTMPNASGAYPLICDETNLPWIRDRKHVGVVFVVGGDAYVPAPGTYDVGHTKGCPPVENQDEFTAADGCNATNVDFLVMPHDLERKLHAFFPLSFVKNPIPVKEVTLNLTSDITCDPFGAPENCTRETPFLQFSFNYHRMGLPPGPVVPNDKPFLPNPVPIEVELGETVCINIVNRAAGDHIIHMHGHHFQVVELDGVPIPGGGAMRDTVMVSDSELSEYFPLFTGFRSAVEQRSQASLKNTKICFLADNPGVWAIHCHFNMHATMGMMTTIEYNAGKNDPPARYGCDNPDAANFVPGATSKGVANAEDLCFFYECLDESGPTDGSLTFAFYLLGATYERYVFSGGPGTFSAWIQDDVASYFNVARNAVSVPRTFTANQTGAPADAIYSEVVVRLPGGASPDGVLAKVRQLDSAADATFAFPVVRGYSGGTVVLAAPVVANFTREFTAKVEGYCFVEGCNFEQYSVKPVLGSTVLAMDKENITVSNKTYSRWYLAGAGQAWKKVSNVNGVWIPKTDNNFRIIFRNTGIGGPGMMHAHGQTPVVSVDGVPYISGMPIYHNRESLYVYELHPQNGGSYLIHSHYGWGHDQGLGVPLIVERDPPVDYPGRADLLSAKQALFWFEELCPYHLFQTPELECSAAAIFAAGTPFSGPNNDLGLGGYRHYLVNHHTLDDPWVEHVEAGNKTLLRLISSSTHSNLKCSLGTLGIATIVAADGQWVQPVPVTEFWLGVAQRLDILISNPVEPGAYPLVCAETSLPWITDRKKAGIVFVVGGAAYVPAPRTYDVGHSNGCASGVPEGTDGCAGAYFEMTHDTEKLLHAYYPLEAGPADVELTLNLTTTIMCDFATNLTSCTPENPIFRFGFDDQPWFTTPLGNDKPFVPNPNPIKVQLNQKVCINMVNKAAGDHIIHMHGHHFQVVEVDGQPIPGGGAMRDTVLVGDSYLSPQFVGQQRNWTTHINSLQNYPFKNTKICFLADNPGIWALHCHYSMHLVSGMMTTVEYTSSDSDPKPVRGCTNTNDEAFTLEATVDDGSCAGSNICANFDDNLPFAGLRQRFLRPPPALGSDFTDMKDELVVGADVLTYSKHRVEGKGPHFKTISNVGTLIMSTTTAHFRVLYRNKLNEPAIMHAHGLTPVHNLDGVSYLTSMPIQADRENLYVYELHPQNAGTYILHAHYGWGHDEGLAIPLVVQRPPPTDYPLVNELNNAIESIMFFEELCPYHKDPSKQVAPWECNAGEILKEGVVPLGPWHDLGLGGFRYYLANKRVLDNPWVEHMPAGAKVRLRMVNAAVESLFRCHLGALAPAQAVAVDGQWVHPVNLTDARNSLWVGTGQRLDLLLTMPNASGAYPLICDETNLPWIRDRKHVGVVFVVGLPPVENQDEFTAADGCNATNVDFLVMPHDLERKLHAFFPLSFVKNPIPVKEVTLNLTSDITCDPFVAPENCTRETPFLQFSFNYHRMGLPPGPVVPNDKPFLPNPVPIEVELGETVCINIVNRAAGDHIIHMHGHHFQVVELDGVPIPGGGAMRDTVMVSDSELSEYFPLFTGFRSAVEQRSQASLKNTKICFLADNPGVWAIHCHFNMHATMGMLTTIEYKAGKNDPPARYGCDNPDAANFVPGATSKGVANAEDLCFFYECLDDSGPTDGSLTFAFYLLGATYERYVFSGGPGTFSAWIQDDVASYFNVARNAVSVPRTFTANQTGAPADAIYSEVVVRLPGGASPDGVLAKVRQLDSAADATFAFPVVRGYSGGTVVLAAPVVADFTRAPAPPTNPAACVEDVGYDLSFDLISVINDDLACDFPNYFHDEATGCPSSSCGIGPLDRPCCPCLEKIMQVLLTSRVSSGMLGLEALTECRLSTVGECPVLAYVNAMKACSGLNATSSPNLTSGVAALEAIIAGGFLNPRTLAYSERGFGGIPAAPALAVGPNHLITVVRSSFGRAFYRVYIKQPWLQVKQSFLTQFHRSSTICRTGPFVGAPQVLYDHLADRWLIMELARNTTGGHFLCLIMSLTGVPYGLLYRGHTIALPGNPGEIAIAVMPDAYYFGTTENPPAVYALDRARLITGGVLRPMVRLQAPALSGLTLQGLIPGHLAGGPRAGSSCGLFARPVDDELHSQSPDRAADFLEVWEFCPRFDNATTAQLTRLANVRISEFNATLCGSSADSACFSQPGSATRLTTYQNGILSRVQYRSFNDRESLLGTFTVNGGNDRGAVMWVELQRTINASGALGPWERVQDGVTPSDNKNRWQGSAAMDQSGDIVLSYSVVDASNSTYPSLYYTGRGRFAPYGTMPSPETLLAAGTLASATSSFGGRSAMAVDPVDGCKLYFLGPWETAASRSATYLGAVNFARCTDSAECLLNTDCDDGQFCTLDKCRDGKCVSEPDILLCRFGEICDEEADVCKVP